MQFSLLRLTEARVETEIKTEFIQEKLKNKDEELAYEQSKLNAQRDENLNLKKKLEDLKSQFEALRQQ